ncbi:MAG: serine/threonine-protein kinase [Acidobacteriota bacterium]
MSSRPQLESSNGSHELLPGTLLENRYRIVRQLGKGGMGAVYEAVDERLGISVALKETLSAEAGGRRQFEQEARLLAGLQHPALPRVTDHFAEGSRAFLVMQFIAGVDLAKIIYQQPGPLPRDQVVKWADQLLDALVYLHSQDRQVIHRDIKPHNLKLTASGQIALLDFGLAKAQHSEGSTTSSAAFYGYTRQYSPLEQIQDLSTGPQSDIYALGATLYHLLTGVKPADALTRAASLANSEPDPLEPANAIHAAVGEELAGILSKAMAQKAADRYRDAAEFREALRLLGRRTSQPILREPQSVNGTVLLKSFDETTLFQSLPASGLQRRGPSLITCVMLICLTATMGVAYAYQHWNDWSASLSEKPKRTEGASQDSGLSIRLERAPVTNNGIAPNDEKRSDTTVGNGRSQKNAAVAEAGHKNKVKLEVPSKVTHSSPSHPARVPGREIKIPNIRLPEAEIPSHNAPPRHSDLPWSK